MAEAPGLGPDFPEGVALVVGGSGGVGAAICVALAARGSPVALTCRANPTAAEAAAEAVRAHGVAAEVHRLELSDRAATAALLADLEARHGAVHTVISAAGPDLAQPYVSQVEDADWDAVVARDLGGVFGLIKEAIPVLRRARGSLIALSSAGVRRHPPGDVLSTVPKAGIEALIRAVAREEGRSGVRANCVALGVIDAGQFQRGLARGDFSADWLEAARTGIPLRRWGHAAEAAEAVAFLASRRAGYVTGQTLMVDGGWAG